MSVQSQFTADEIGQRGEEIYAQKLRKQVEEGNFGKYIAIDILTGEYEIGDDRKNVNAHLETVHRLLNRIPNAIVYTILIGYPAAAAIGASLHPLHSKTP